MKTAMTALFAALILSVTSATFADTVLLKNGESITGTWVKADDKTITLQVDKKLQTIELAEVFRVSFGTPIAIATIVIEDVKYEVIEAKAGSDSLTIYMMATNQSSDGGIVMCNGKAWPSCGKSGVRLYDDRGMTYNATDIKIGNQSEKSRLINGVRTPLTVQFTKLPASRGVIEATRIERLEFAPFREGTRTAAKGEFRDLAIQK